MTSRPGYLYPMHNAYTDTLELLLETFKFSKAAPAWKTQPPVYVWNGKIFTEQKQVNNILTKNNVSEIMSGYSH